MADSQYAIETISLTKIFPDWWGRARVVAVDDLNLKIKHNEIYGFLGPNGSGKTTTIKLLLNLLHPTRGGSLVFGGNGADPKISIRIGYLPEESYLYRYLTAYETLDFYGRLFGLPSNVRNARIETLLEMVGLAGVGKRQVGTFSKGMARRIGLAQALINDPDLLILDEPTSGMDPMGTRQMKDLLMELGRRGKTILLCSHLLADVEDICDRIGIMYGGKMQVEGSVRELLEQTGKTQIQAQQLSESVINKIQHIIQQENKDFEITHPMDKLESFFVRIVTRAQQQAQPTSGAKMGSSISGFLADKEVLHPASILDKLVTGKPEESPAAIDHNADVTKTQPVDTGASLKADVIHRLIQGKPEIVRTSVQSETNQVKEIKPAEVIKKELLDDLLDKGKKTDGSTTPTENKSAGD